MYEGSGLNWLRHTLAKASNFGDQRTRVSEDFAALRRGNGRGGQLQPAKKPQDDRLIGRQTTDMNSVHGPGPTPPAHSSYGAPEDADDARDSKKVALKARRRAFNATFFESLASSASSGAPYELCAGGVGPGPWTLFMSVVCRPINLSSCGFFAGCSCPPRPFPRRSAAKSSLTLVL